MNYWMQALPLPKSLIHKINVICRTFLWTGNKEKSRKSLIAWKNVCSPKHYGWLNLIDLQTWNNAVLTKLLWNLNGKCDNLWVKRVHGYYMKNKTIMLARNNLGGKIQQRDKIAHLTIWEEMLQREKFRMQVIY